MYFRLEDAFLEAFNMVEGLTLKVDLMSSNLSKSNKRDDIQVLLNNLITAVSNIEELVSKLERGVLILPYLFTYRLSYFFKLGFVSTKNVLNKGVQLIAKSLINFFLSQVLRTYGNVMQIL